MNDTQKKLITTLWQIQDIDFKYNWTVGFLSNYLQASTQEQKNTVEKNILQLPELHLINMDIDNVLKFLKIQEFETLSTQIKKQLTKQTNK